MSKKQIGVFIAIIVILAASLFYVNKVINNGNKKLKSTAENMLKGNSNKTDNSRQQNKTQKNDTNISKVGIEAGDIAPDFTLQDINGNTITLSKLRGKNVLINFWATTCPYCRIEMPYINSFYSANKADIEVLAVNIGESEATIKNYLNGKGYNFKVLEDTTGEVAYYYGIRFIPTSYFIDKNGIIKAVANGAMTGDQLKQYYQMLK